MSKFAWVTLTTNDTYSLGALVLAHSLRRVSTAHQLAVLITPGVSEAMRAKLKDVYNVVQEVNVMDSQDAANLALLARPELGVTFTKLHCWRLVQFEKCVFLDADTLVLQNCDELFEREEFSAAPDVSWPDCFNSGVFVYRPSLDTFAKITEFALKNGSFDGGDQGILNQYFSDWAHKDISKHLPFTYNTTAYATYCYLPAFKQFRDRIKILHFAGKLKPWLATFNSETKTAYTPEGYEHAADLIQLWWNIFCSNVHQQLSDQMNYYISETQTDQKHIEDYIDVNYEHFESSHVFHDPWEDYYENLEKMKISEENNKLRNDEIQNESEDNENEFHTPNYTLDTNLFTFNEQSRTYDECLKDDTYSGESHNKDTNIEDEKIELYYDSTDQYSNESYNLNIVNDEQEFFSEVREKIMNEISQLVSRENDIVSNTVLTSLPSESEEQDTNYVESENEAGLAGALSSLRLGEARSPEQEAYEQHMRRQCWESGNIDYTGKDSFDNIWKKISQTIEAKPAQETPKSDEPEKPGSI